MNKIYKVIWNATLLAWVAVSELAKGKTKSTTSKSKAKSLSSSVIVGGIILTTPLSLIAATVQVGGGTNSGTTATASTNCADLYNYQNPENSGSGAAGNYNAGNPSVCSIAIGENAQGGTSGTGGSSGIAIGGNSKATGGLSVAIGGYAQATNVGSFALGTAALSSGFNSLAISRQAAATNNYSIAIGTTSVSKGVGSIAMGHSTNASGDQSIAIGSSDAVNSATATTTYDGTTNTQASGSKSIAIGASAKASTNNSIALGAGSVTSAQSGNSYLTGVGASATNGVVSVGTSTATRRIQNVADGSAASDAVTVAQLDKAYDDTNGRLAAALGTGSGAAYNAANNTYTAPTNIGGTGKNTIDEAIKATQRSVVAGSNIVVTPTTAADGSISYSVATSATPTFTSVTVNNAPTAGTDATNKTYVDSKAAASKTEVTAGTNVSGVAKTTGANGQDVYTVNANGTTASAGSSAVTVTAGTKNASNVTDYKVDLSTATKTDIQKGVDAKTAVDSTGLTFKGDTTATSATKKLGDTVSITGDTNISTVATTDGVQVKLNPNLNLGTTGSVTTGATVINNAGITANKVTINNAPTVGTDATNKTYVDSKAAASRTEVAAGTNVSGVAKTTGANGQDVYTVNANGTTASAGSSAVTVTAGTKDANNVTDYKVDLAASTKTDIQKGVDAKTAVDSTGLKFKGDTATTSATKKLGDTVSITGDTNISTVATTDGVQVKLNPNLDLGTAGSVKTGNTTINNAGVTADQVTVGGVVINKTTGINAGGLAITNVATPTAGTDATNKTYVDSKAAASRTEVAAGSNVSGVVKTTGANGQD
ncbi:ESPR-type extended signal peptide-containing protein, partial [Acinetobacter bereziniae]|uniref:ESPR-type extended signal peptide-containing protein n=1 Tax=Acinetobacter bereziniae TaxID=106648 RepID=UPI003212342B